MSMEKSKYDQFDPFSSSFNALKLRYKDYDESLTSKNFLNKYDKINVFINLESVFKNLSMIQDLEKKILLYRDFESLIIANILNLAAHYKRFFVSNSLDTKIYLYHTDFNSDEFVQYKYNDDFRSYYLNKFNSNPKYIVLTEKLKENILPDVKTYIEFIPNVYYISAHNIEGSLIPYTIANMEPERKNLVITGEFYESQYSVINNFVNHLIIRGVSYTISSSVFGYLKSMTKKEDSEITRLNDIYNKNNTYCSLIASLGDKTRSIDSLSGIGPFTLENLIKQGIAKNKIKIDSSSPEVIGEIFTDSDMKKEFTNNYYCTNIENMYEELTDADKTSISNQIIDRSDNESLITLNKTVFADHPLILEGLLC